MKHRIIIRMGAANWDVRVRTKSGEFASNLPGDGNFRKMTKKQRSDFHREFMNAFRTAWRDAVV